MTGSVRVLAGMLAVFLVGPAASADSIAMLRIATNSLVYDPFAQQIEASVPGRAGLTGNSVVRVDPLTGDVSAPLFVGSEPGRLALSDDGRYLYVALDGAAAVRRVDLAAGRAGLQFPIGYSPYAGAYVATGMAVLPGQPRSVALALVDPLDFVGDLRPIGIAIDDDGLMRPALGGDFITGAVRIAFSASASRLYAVGVQIGGEIERIAVDWAGAATLDRTPGLITGAIPEIHSDGGLLYTDSGSVIDPEARKLKGAFGAFPPGTVMAPDAALGKAFFLEGDGPTRALEAFDLRTFRSLGLLTVPGVRGQAGSLIRWGLDGLAFRTDQNQLFLIRTGLVTPSDLALTLHPTAVVGGRALTGRITLRQPAGAGGAAIRLHTGSPAVAVPDPVMVPAGALSTTFPVETVPVGLASTAEIVATRGGLQQSAALTLLPSALESVAFNPGAVLGGIGATGTVTVNDPPVEELRIGLAAGNPAVQVPAAITLPAGETRVDFPVVTSPVVTEQTAVITADSLGTTQSGRLKLLAVGLQSLALTPNEVPGGALTATVTLTGPAPPDGAAVVLTSVDPVVLSLAQEPYSLLVPPGQASASFTLVVDRVSARTLATVTATYGGVSRSARLTVLPPAGAAP